MGCAAGKRTLGAGLATGLVAAALAALAPAAASAAGETYAAAPSGSGTECTVPSPCKIEKAVSLAGDGDTVGLQGGEYELPFAGLRIEDEIDFGGTPGAV